jgi:hypothetical protein
LTSRSAYANAVCFFTKAASARTARQRILSTTTRYWTDAAYEFRLNAKFSRPAADAHIPPGNVNLSDILYRECKRTVGGDYVVRFGSRHFQILKTTKNLPRPKDKVTVLIMPDDSFCTQWKKYSLLAPEIEIQKNDRSGNNAA